MKKVIQQKHGDDRETMRTEYDFSGAVRGVSAAIFAQGANIVVGANEELQSGEDRCDADLVW